jgi:hypothetical protein
MPKGNGGWWNGGWQRWGKSEWNGEKESYLRCSDLGSVTFIDKGKGFWIDGEPGAHAKNIKKSKSSEDVRKLGIHGSQTLEFHSQPKHDENFNEITKSIEESWAAAIILKNPEIFGVEVYELSVNLAKIIKENPEQVFFIKVIADDVSRPGQFARIKRDTGDILTVLESKSMEPIVFAQKILLLKAFGAYVIDHARHNPSDNLFISPYKNIDYESLILKYRPDSLFHTRGRTDIKCKTERHDIGIMSEKTSLNLRNPEHFTIAGLSKERPLFRTFISDKSSGKTASFIERTFDKDEPLIGAISGSTSCIMVGFEILKKTDLDSINIALSAAGFLVGGGYHSQAEVMEIALPGMTMHDGIKMALKSRYSFYKNILDDEIVSVRRNI